ncbi:MAG: tetratricopeptide repeat protein [Chthoniobacterales bacterium]
MLGFRRACWICALVFFCGAVANVPAQSGQAGDDLATAYKQAMDAFSAGDYPKAAADLERLIGRVEFSPQLEPIYYTIGSAYFNAGNYPKAIAAFKTYQAKFPHGPHAGSAAFAIAQSNLLSKNYKEAAAQMAVLERDPALREQALLFEAEADKAAGKTDAEIASLEKLVGSEIKSSQAMRGATMLAQLYAGKGNGPKALHVLALIHQKTSLVDNVVELNALTVQLGDKFYEKQEYKDALACYRYAYPEKQIVRLQTERIAALQQQIEKNLAKVRANPSEITQLASQNSEIKSDIANAQKLLADFQKLPTVTSAIYLRLARCFYELDRKWESIVVDQEILERFPKGPEVEPALFGLIVALADVGQADRAEERCQQYLRDFKNGPNAATVGYLLGAVALQAGDPKAAETYFGHILASQPKSKFREQIRYLLAKAKF